MDRVSHCDALSSIRVPTVLQSCGGFDFKGLEQGLESCHHAVVY